jgi:hypothetical protein
MTNSVVVYTPQENFFYNTTEGSTLLAYFFAIITGMMLGAVVSECLSKNFSDRVKSIVGAIVFVGTVVAIKRFFI